MIKKLPIKETMKPVIEALREGKKSWGDLKELKVQNREIPDKTLDRLLKNLDYWGLAEKEGDFWVWYEYSRVFTPHNFDLAMKHSKRLLFQFQTLVHHPDKNSQDLEYVAMKEHLKFYHDTDTYLKLEKYEKAFIEIKKKINANKEMLSKFFPNLNPFRIIEDYDKSFKATTPDEEKLKDELEKELDKFYWETYSPLKRDLGSLETKIAHRNPLEGKCSLCREVKIMEEGGKADRNGVEP